MKVHYQVNISGAGLGLTFVALLVSFLLLLPLFVFGASSDAVLQGGTEITANGVTVTVAESGVESITVNSDNFTVDLAPGSQIALTSTARASFTVSPSSRVESFTCGSSESLLIVKGPPSGNPTVTVTITPSSTTCGTGGGSGIVGGGGSSVGGGGGSGASVTVPAAVTTAPAVSVAQPSAVALAVSPVFTGKLNRGISSSEVKRLQQLLNSDPDTRIASSGVGSSGNETNFYGSLTEVAVKKFQAKYGIVSSGTPETTGYGLIGPKTRAKLAEVFGAGVVPATPAAPGSTATQEAALQQQISGLLKLVEELQKQIQALIQ